MAQLRQDLRMLVIFPRIMFHDVLTRVFPVRITMLLLVEALELATETEPEAPETFSAAP